MNDHLRELRILASTVSRVDEGILAFDAIAEHAKTLNEKGFGEAFRYIQNAAITDLVMAFGRLVSRGKREVSFLSASIYIQDDQVLFVKPIRDFLVGKSINFEEKAIVEAFRKDFVNFNLEGYEKIKRLRDKMVAHHEKGVKSEEVGATFIDARAFVEDAYRKIDACYFSFFEVSVPHLPLSILDGQHSARTEKSLRRSIKILSNVDVAAP